MRKLLPLIFLLFSTLYATNVLPVLVEDEEPFEKKSDFYISSRNAVLAIAISGDGKTIISGSLDSNIKIIDMTTAKILKSLEGHKSWVTSVAISENGKTIVSASRAISNDGKTIVSKLGDKNIQGCC